jgi:hypothetical protein
MECCTGQTDHLFTRLCDKKGQVAEIESSEENAERTRLICQVWRGSQDDPITAHRQSSFFQR